MNRNGKELGFSLKEICLKVIADHIDEWFCSSISELTLKNSMYVLGPFECLDSESTQQLINLLSMKKKLKVMHLHLLLHSRLEAIDFTVPCAFMNDIFIKKLEYRCPKLIRISLKNCSKVTAKAIKCLAEAFNALQYLDLSNCYMACKDDVLSCIGNNCAQLRQLILDGCSMITDTGIKNFCQCYAKANRDRKLLRKLSLVNTQITDAGLREVLQTFRLLSTLSVSGCRDIVDPFCSFIPQKKLFSLSILDLSNTGINDISVDHITTLCPGLHDINISNCDNVTDVTITTINSISGVRSFSIAGCHLITFTIGIIPLLYNHGYQLETLNLSGMDNIDLAAIWHLCPRLKVLIMESCKDICQTPTYGIDTNQSRHLHLQKLNLKDSTFYQGEADIDESRSDCLKFIKKFCGNTLKYLYWSRMEGITDSLICDFLNEDCFKSLTYLELRYCHNITSDSLEQILQCCPSLQQLDIRFCQQISTANNEELKSYADEINHNVTILWE
ncbi:F-box/LRR-repeat protein 4 [Trichoplax sp. H2]|nr:F-box/LRR-repeat protein 4 [Trichoplax sp. H2]|eukprot:RDD38315.1 F-box/LRR-repeat protein 4 [Trichoplax sp. H2]